MTLLEECRALLPAFQWSMHQDARPIERGAHGWDSDRRNVVVTIDEAGLYHAEVSYHHERVKEGPHGKREEYVNTSGDAVAPALREAYEAACEEYTRACKVPRPVVREVPA